MIFARLHLALAGALIAAGATGLHAGTGGFGGDGGIAMDSESGYHDLYRWGEYDSLIRFLAPRLDADSIVSLPAAGTRSDSLEQAKANLCLGVGWWAIERKPASLRAFTRAAQLDPGLRLDPLYSTREMAAEYETLLSEVERSRAPAEPPSPMPARSAAGKDAVPALGRKSASGWLLWTGALAATGAVAGAYYIVNGKSKPDETVITIKPARPE